MARNAAAATTAIDTRCLDPTETMFMIYVHARFSGPNDLAPIGVL
jgi:hypothetical protein